ncbi:flagellar filament capping protein FliD [Desulfovibrio intestinalis]|uniref:Filament cap protein n=1 Tax=Desulfovibrio intestinalis TaxID=58621 RepID=A0A7W8C069_9BACT|nr:flagellar filament capping protein FliD [Desulfovibrio intestinalis]MBB5143153.1 flagellar hook-associated protein 2 [Desulfovibrio intestinalis]
MATSISGSNAISGLSGMDTNFDEVLAKLKKVESTQLNRLTAWKSDWNLRYEAFGSIIEQVQIASSVLSNLGNKNSFVSKNVSSSNDNVLTAVANASAQDVQHTINVLQMANNAVWANTGHVFSSKTDVINDSGVDQNFTFTYAGTTKSIKIPPKTTLESFASMVNNSTENPGIKVSLVQTGTGYVFQVAGKSTGAENDLIVHNSGLVGMSSAGSTSVWKTNSALDLGATLSDPKKYAFDLFMEDGSKFTVSITGDKTNQNLADQINTQTGRNVATLDSSGNLTLSGVSAMYQRDTSVIEKSATASTKVTVGSDPINTKLQADLTMTLNYDDGVTTGTRQLTIKAGTNLRDALIQMAQSTGMKTADLSMDSSGRWSVNLNNITGITFDSGADPADTALFTTTTTASTLGTRIDDTLSSASTSINFKGSMLSSKLGGSSADGTKNFTYTIVDKSGNTQTITLANDATYQDLANEIQAKTGVAPTSSGSDLSFSLDNTLQFYVSQGTGGGMDGLTTSTATTTSATGLTPGNQLDATQPPLKYTITLNDGTQIAVPDIASGSSMQDVVNSIQQTLSTNAAAQAAGATASLVKADGTPWSSAADGDAFLSITNVQSVSGPGIKGQVASSSNWNIQRSTNARFTVDNWPIEMESASNSVSDVIEGVVFTIQDTGQARISVSTDITSVETSIQTFLDAVNSVLLTIREFTKFDEDKETTTNDPDHASNSNYSPSQLTAEKGGLLQGNYGVQLFKSRFNSLLGSSPPGFKSRTSADDLLSGDVLANLANLGIKVNNNEASDKFGLLEIAPSSSIAALQQMDQDNYTNMITNNLEAVVDFFCTDGTGTSTSSSFRYGSHVAGITKAGTYDVSYTVDASGNIEKVMVGGVEAKRDLSQAGYYYSVGSGDGRGLAILIDDLSEGEHTGQVRIKEGLVQTVNSFLKSELVFNDVNISGTDPSKNADAIALKSQNGALMVLRNNYKTIMDNIDKKITQEQNRLSLWETRQKRYFANLETLLSNYSSMQSQLESQIAKMNSSSSS